MLERTPTTSGMRPGRRLASRKTKTRVPKRLQHASRCRMAACDTAMEEVPGRPGIFFTRGILKASPNGFGVALARASPTTLPCGQFSGYYTPPTLPTLLYAQSSYSSYPPPSLLILTHLERESSLLVHFREAPINRQARNLNALYKLLSPGSGRFSGAV